MPTSWDGLALWFVTAVAGAFFVKLIDLAADRFRQNQSRREKMVDDLISYVKEFGRLTEMYRSYATFSSSIARDGDGNLIKDPDGDYIVEYKLFEPRAEFEENYKALNNGVPLKTAIEQQEIKIRLMSTDMLDMTLDLDPSGELKEHFARLFGSTAWHLRTTLESKHKGNPKEIFDEMKRVLDESDRARRELRATLSKYCK